MRIALRAVAFVVLILSARLWAAENPLVGTWKVNLQKSKFGTGQPPRSQVIKLEHAPPNGLKFTEDSVNAQGQASHHEYTAQFDGKDYPIVGVENRDAASFNRIDEYTLEITSKKAGKVTNRIRRVVAKDGKSMVATFSDADGKPQDRMLVFEKQ